MTQQIATSIRHDLAGQASIATRTGQFLFVGSITPHDPATGRLITGLDDLPEQVRRLRLGKMLIDIPLDRALAQTWAVYATLSQILADYGASLDDLLRQRIFLANLQDLPAVQRVMDHFLPGTKPATTITAMPTQGVNPELVVQIDAVALIPEAGGLTKQTIEVPGLERATNGFPQATRAGQFLFVSNTVGINPATGRMASSLSELGQEADRLADYPLLTSKDEAILAQAWFTFENIDRTLKTQGASLADILKVNGWLSFVMREFGPLLIVREHFFSQRAAMPASASIGIQQLASEGALLGYECVALVPPTTEGDFGKDIRLNVSDLAAMYVPVIGAGPLIFTCGEVPLDVPGQRVITRFDQLDETGRYLPFGRLHTSSDIQARAWYVYKLHESYLKAHDVTFDDVVHQTVFMMHPDQYPSLERVASLFFGTKVPPTTLVPITDTSPFPEAQIEIELVAAKSRT